MKSIKVINNNEKIDESYDKLIIINRNENDNYNLSSYKIQTEQIINGEKIEIWKKNGIDETEICFIIQGRIHDTNLIIKNIENLSKYGEIIVSPTLESTILFTKNNKIVNDQNIYLQVTSTLTGLKKNDKKYSIKVRGDEYYKDYTKFIEKMTSNPDKIITNNIFFRKISRHPYHISDHIIGGRTDNLIEMFTNCKRSLEIKRVPELINKGIPEQWLTMSYLEKKYNKEDLKIKKKEIMLKHFDIICLEEFEDFVVTYTKHERGKRHRFIVNGTKELLMHKIIDIKNINEI